jgi:hypothetical protein
MTSLQSWATALRSLACRCCQPRQQHNCINTANGHERLIQLPASAKSAATCLHARELVARPYRNSAPRYFYRGIALHSMVPAQRRWNHADEDATTCTRASCHAVARKHHTPPPTPAAPWIGTAKIRRLINCCMSSGPRHSATCKEKER